MPVLAPLGVFADVSRAVVVTAFQSASGWMNLFTPTSAVVMGGLALAKSARGMLEHAEKINPAALGDGSVYTSLGSLYAQVPGFPIGFGDPGKARAYLAKALAANPRGVDPNFFQGDFLMRQGD